jgi:hypothetical protein
MLVVVQGFEPNLLKHLTVPKSKSRVMPYFPLGYPEKNFPRPNTLAYFGAEKKVL